MRHLQTYLLAAALLTLIAQTAHAQFDGPPPDRGQAREKLDQLRHLKLIEALDLDEEQAVRLTIREKEFRKAEEEHFKARKELLAELSELIEDEAGDESYRQLLARMHAMNTDFMKRKHEYVLSLTDILSMKQVAKLVLFEHRFAEEVRRILSNTRGRGKRR